MASTSNCGILITCFKPTDHPTPTDSFRIELQTKASGFHEYAAGANCKMLPGQVQCLIGMKAL